MSRDVVFATLALVLCGAGTWLSSWLPAGRAHAADELDSGRALERHRWRRLWLPMLPAALALATLLGWVLQEPRETDELLHPLVALLVLPLGVIWLRAAGRAALALRRPQNAPPVATFGLFRPRVAVQDGLRQILDEVALAAALNHERAHARHRDPLRIWLAQIATDAQWPSPAARRRFDQWLVALEIARDEEARRDGARGEDLAAAVVAVAGMIGARPRFAAARLTGAELALAARVRRLLEPLPGDRVTWSWPLLGSVVLVVSLTGALILGLEFGDSLLRALPIITTSA